jgi:hypothetical protein
MTKDKDRKRLVRARMRKTGESYTAARANLVDEPVSARSGRSAKARPPLPAEYEKLGGMSDAALAKATGRSWPEWAEILDQAGAAGWEHRRIAEHLHAEQGVGDWWAQMVTVGYERLRGLRDVGQRRGGGYEVSKSKTLAVSVAEVWRAFGDPRRRRTWLPDLALEVTTATEPKSMRIKLDDGSRIDVYFTAKGASKASVALQHRKLADRKAADDMRAFWTARLEALRTALEDGRAG